MSREMPSRRGSRVWFPRMSSALQRRRLKGVLALEDFELLALQQPHTPICRGNRTGSMRWWTALRPPVSERCFSRSIRPRSPTGRTMSGQGFSTPLRPSLRLAWQGMSHPSWTLGVFLRTVLTQGIPHFENSYATRGAPILAKSVMRDFGDRDQLNWIHLGQIRKRWAGNLVVKDIMHPADAVRALDVGVDGIIVSNHGGRQLDGTVSSAAGSARYCGCCAEGNPGDARWRHSAGHGHFEGDRARTLSLSGVHSFTRQPWAGWRG